MTRLNPPALAEIEQRWEDLLTQVGLPSPRATAGPEESWKSWINA